MITAQDIREKVFSKAAFGGYAMGEVDDYLDILSNELAAAQKESGTLRSKMKVLAAKIEEYRSTEDSMRLALASAQKIARDIEESSKAQAEELLANARREAEETIAAARAEADAITSAITAKADAEEFRFTRAKAAAAEYIEKVRVLTEHEAAFLTSLEGADLTGYVVTPAPAEKKAIAAPEEPEEAAEEAPAEVPEYVRAFEEAVYGAAEETEEAAEEIEEAAEEAVETAEETVEEAAEEIAVAAEEAVETVEEAAEEIPAAEEKQEETFDFSEEDFFGDMADDEGDDGLTFRF